jgi:diguanylate cyclase (GGDEF)-like protein
MRTVTGKLLLVLIPLLLTLAVVFLFAFNSIRQQELERRHVDKLEELVSSYANALQYPLWSFDVESVEFLISTLDSVQDVSCVLVRDSILNRNWGSEDSGCRNEGLDVFTAPVMHESEQIGELTVFYTYDSMLSNLEDELYQGLFLVGGLLLMLLIGALLAQRLLVGRPLNSLLSSIRRSHESEEYGEVCWNTRDEFGVIVSAFNDLIQKKKSNEEKILHQAHYDHLTDLPNRFLSLDRLTQLMKEAARDKRMVAVLFVDLDDFKKVNDSLGHEVGDKLLTESARRLTSLVRAGDTVGRLGGDEFVVLLGDIGGPVDSQVVAENLLSRFREVFRIDGRELVLTASVGIAVYPNDSDTASGLLRNADAAMYHSKSFGRNTYSFFTEEMNRDVLRRLELEEQIHGAVGRGEFTVVYQPQYDMATGKIIGAEALLRWSNPVLGQVPPACFIPIAEQTGLIVSLGGFVLQEALSRTREWLDESTKDFRIAVNLSPRQFRSPDLLEQILRNLKKFRVEAQSLELEITEGVLMSGHAYIDQMLMGIKKMGINLAMDDFGTGYSSLNYLRRYPFHALKVDKSFVNDIITDPADRELIQAAISMAHGLGLAVVAEGVETQEQWDLLQKMGCDYAQGYLMSKPIAAEAVSELLRQSAQIPDPAGGRQAARNP